MAACLRALRSRVWIGIRFDAGDEPYPENLYVEPEAGETEAEALAARTAATETPEAPLSPMKAMVRPRTSLVADLETAVNKVLLCKETHGQVGGGDCLGLCCLFGICAGSTNLWGETQDVTR